MTCQGYGKRFFIANSSTGINTSVYCPGKKNMGVMALIGESPSSVSLSAISFNGTTLTAVGSTNVANSSGLTCRTMIYGVPLGDMTAGFYNFTLSVSGTVDLDVQLIFFYNVQQTGTFTGGATATGNSVAPANLTMSGATNNVEDMVYDVLCFLTPSAIISNDGTAGPPQSWLSAYMTQVGGPIQVCTECGYSSAGETLAWQTLDGSAHNYAWSGVCVAGIPGNTEVYDIPFDNTTDANSACDASTFNFDAYEAGDVATVDTTVLHWGSPTAIFSSLTGPGNPNAAREWFNAPEIWTSCWMTFDQLVTDGPRNLVWQGTYTDNGDINIDANNDRTLRIRINSVVKANTAFKVTVGVWFKLSLHHLVNGASSQYEIKINETQEILNYTDNVAQSNINLIQFNLDNNGQTGVVRFAHLKADRGGYPYEDSHFGSKLPAQIPHRPAMFKPGNAR